MPRTIIIRIVIDNRDALNQIKAQEIANRDLERSIKFANDELRKNEKANKDVGASADKAAHSHASFADSMIKAYVAVQALNIGFSLVKASISGLISQTAGLELNLAKIASVTGRSVDVLGGLEETIFKLGRTSNVSVEEISGAALELAKLGFAGQDLVTVLSGVTQLSSVLGDNLEATGNLVGGVIQTFNLSADEAAKVADKLFIATGQSATNIEGFRVAFSLAGNVAAQVGVSFEDLASAIAMLSNQGIRASTIGTGLRTFLLDLAQDGSKAQKLLGGSAEDLGLVGAMKRLAEIQPSEGSVLTAFGKPASPVVNGLIRGSEAFDKMKLSIENSNGALKDSSIIINDTLIGSITTLKNSVVELYETFAKSPTGGFSSFLRDIGGGLQLIAEGRKAFSELDQLQARLGGSDKTYQLFKDAGVLQPGADPKELRSQIESYQEWLKVLEVEKQDALASAKALKTLEDQHKDLHQFTGKDKAAFTPKSVFDPKVYINEIQQIKEAFAEYKNGSDDPFSFSKSRKELEKIRDYFKGIKDFKDANKAQSAITSLDNYEKQDAAAGFEKNKQAYERDKALEKAKKKNITTSQTDSLGEYDQYIFDLQDKVDNFNQGLEVTKVLTEDIGSSFKKVTDEAIDDIFRWEFSWTHWGYTMKSILQDFVKDLIAVEVRLLAIRTVLAITGLFTSGATAPIAGSLGPSLVAPDLAGIAPLTLAATGYDGFVNKPTHFVAGEAGKERVTISPSNKPGFYGDGNGGGMTIIVQGDVFNAEKLIEKINQSNELSRARYV